MAVGELIQLLAKHPTDRRVGAAIEENLARLGLG